VPREVIEPRLSGVYDPARFAKPLAVSFFDGGAVNYPRASDGLWFVTQYRRWGMLGGASHAGDAQLAAAVSQTGLYREAASIVGVPLPDERRVAVLCDGIAWDGDDRAYLDGFGVRA
jgi:nitrate/nitrite transport system substrate-binding protein